jgi:hypothetical protein
MKNYLFVLIFGVALIGQINIANAGVLFWDNFNTDGLDTTKWTTLTDPGCSLDVSGGVLHNYFTGAAAPRSSYAQSIDIALPSDWSSVTITGQWAYPVSVYGEMVMSVKDAGAPANWDTVACYEWNGPGFRTQDSALGVSYTPRSIPRELTDFEWTITPTGWQFKEYRNGVWDTLVDRSTTHMAGMSKMNLMIGGWEYSYTSLQETNYDNINISVVPEPATLCLLGIGALSLVNRKK